MKGFLLREEYFGGLLYDRKSYDYEILNRWQTKALQLADQMNPDDLLRFLQTQNLIAENYDASMDEPIVRDMNKVPSADDLARFLREKSEKGVLVSRKLEADGTRIRRRLKYPMLSAPIGNIIDITDACNMACVHCYNADDRKRDNLDNKALTTNEMLSFFDQASEMGVFYMNLQGGETTMLPDWKKIASRLQDLGVGTTLYTNGFYKGKEHVLAEIAEIPLAEIRITFAGLEDVHNRLRPAKPIRYKIGQPTYEEINKSLDYLLSRKANVKLNFVLGKNNMHQVEEFARAMAKKAIHYGKPFDINFGPQRPFGEGFTCPGDPDGLNMLGAQEFYDVNSLVARLREDHEIKDAGMDLLVVFDIFAKKRDYKPVPRDLRRDGCSTGKRGFSVSYRGDISTCNFMTSCKVISPGGNIKDRTLEQLWFESPLLDQGRYYEKEQCRDCGYYTKQCQGICPAMALYTNLNTTKDTTKGDPGCPKHLVQK